MAIDLKDEKNEARIVAGKLQEPIISDNPDMLAGGYKKKGYGVDKGAAINGSFSFRGSQGYYTSDQISDGKTGKEIFLENVRAMQEFFQKRHKRNGKPIRYIIKPGIGGQHTPFQAIADVFEKVDPSGEKIIGEYELGRNFEEVITEVKKQLDISWNQIAVIPSSKSGTTDETMLIFVEVLEVLLKYAAIDRGVQDGQGFAQAVLEAMKEANFDNNQEKKNEDLFKEFSLEKVAAKYPQTSVDVVKTIFADVLGNMFFETTDRPQDSRLSAFIRNSGLGDLLGEDAPGFGAMFDNVGGRWTGDLHMMSFLAFYQLDAARYWQARKDAIKKVNSGDHPAISLANKILDQEITDIALLVPDELFWFGKATEQNFNESIWQEGFINLVAVRQSDWDSQKDHYIGIKKRMIINLSELNLPPEANRVSLKLIDMSSKDKNTIAISFADLFTTFYGMTSHVGNRLIARALRSQSLRADDIDINELDNPATKILQGNLYLRQPFVELGKGMLKKYFEELQNDEANNEGAIDRVLKETVELANAGKLKSNIDALQLVKEANDLDVLSQVILKAVNFAKENALKFVPFIYLEGEKFTALRDYLINLGIEWVMQGTGDQHISYQQVLAQPKKFLPMIISIIPSKDNMELGRLAVGFAKGYLNQISSNLVRDKFAEFSYQALLDQGGKGLFLRMIDSEENCQKIKTSFKQAV